MKDVIMNMLKDMHPELSFEKAGDFIGEGWLDSFDVVTLIAELEETFSVLISALDIVPENFSSVESICTLIRKSQTSHK